MCTATISVVITVISIIIIVIIVGLCNCVCPIAGYAAVAVPAAVAVIFPTILIVWCQFSNPKPNPIPSLNPSIKSSNANAYRAAI